MRRKLLPELSAAPEVIIAFRETPADGFKIRESAMGARSHTQLTSPETRTDWLSHGGQAGEQVSMRPAG